MTSHRARMHYEQHQKQGSLSGIPRNDSQSSLRSGDQSQYPGSVLSSRVGPIGGPTGEAPSGSVLSGSYLSSRSRSQLGPVASAVNKQYDNLPTGRPSMSQQGPPSISGVYGGAGGSPRMFRTGSMTSYQQSTMAGKSGLGGQSVYSMSQMKMSRSLKASKASLATYKSGRTTIQVEHHDRKVQRELNSIKFGSARRLYWFAVASYIMFLFVLFLGLLIICLRHVYMNIILSVDVGEMTGPVLIASSFLFFGLGMKFYYDAHILGCEERSRIKYKAASPSTVTVTTTNERIADTEEKLVSGKTSHNALTRAPIGSRNTLLVP